MKFTITVINSHGAWGKLYNRPDAQELYIPCQGIYRGTAGIVAMINGIHFSEGGSAEGDLNDKNEIVNVRHTK